jgi:ResB-like family protein
MSRLKRPILWAALIAIILLTGFSIYGAFLGADRARAFFNSLPLAVYWGILAILLGVGIALFRRLLRVPSLLLMHLGCVVVLAGAVWGSEGGHALQKRLFGTDVIREGQMPILEGTMENRVRIADSNDLPELPFFVRLRDVRLEHYPGGTLAVWVQVGDESKLMGRLRADAGETLLLPGNLGRITVEKVFENFKMTLEGEQRVAFDAPGGSNPAVEVRVTKDDGTETTRYVFADFPGHPRPGDPLIMTYQQMVSDYISELVIVEDNKEVASKDIEVNHPLHYGGYHFYQDQYGRNDFGEYTILMVVSDSGVNAVYIGYAMLMAGMCWHFWGRRILAASRNRKPDQEEAATTPINRKSTDAGGADGD